MKMNFSGSTEVVLDYRDFESFEKSNAFWRMKSLNVICSY